MHFETYLSSNKLTAGQLKKFLGTFLKVLKMHVPPKMKNVGSNQDSFRGRQLLNVIMKFSRFVKKYKKEDETQLIGLHKVSEI